MASTFIPDRDSMIMNAAGLRNVLVLALVWIGMIVAIHPVGNFPVNDDWAYAESAKSLIENGFFRVHSTSSANVGPQAYWGALFAWPFGFTFTALRFSTLTLGLLGSIGIYLLFVEVWKDRCVALIAALTLLVNPLYCALANSFMTDVPFFATVVFSMLAIVKGLRIDSIGWLLGGLFLAAVAILIRQLALFLLVGFAFGYIARRGFALKVVLLAVAPLVLGFLLNLLFNRWLVETGRKPYPAGVSELVFKPLREMIWVVKLNAFMVLNYLGLFLLPLVIFCLPAMRSVKAGASRISPAWLWTVAVALLIGYGFVGRDSIGPLGGNVVHWFGIGPLANRDTHLLGLNLPVPDWQATLTWHAVTFLSVIASALIVVTVARELWVAYGAWKSSALQWDRATIARILFLAGAASSYLGILLLIAIGYTLFDRYLLPLTLLCGLVVPFMRKWDGGLSEPSPIRVRGAIAAIVVMGIFSVVATHDFLAWSGTRWKVLQGMLDEGISAHRIDGGYEFSGWYLFDSKYKGDRSKSYWWVDGDEFMVSSGPLPGYREIRRVPVDRWWKAGGSDVVVLRRIAEAH